jgi:CheY-like chemotaxis protein
MTGNLLNNALKFTPRGGRVSVDATARGGVLRVTVTDTGMGIEPADLERIFDPFVQAERTRASAQGGMGIGLALVRELATQHGGSVRAASAGPGQGAALSFELPLVAAPPDTQAEAARGRETRGLRVLIVEDNEDAGATLADVLALDGHEVVVARSARAGIDAAIARPPDVLVCDIGLPDLTGHEVVRAVRAARGGDGIFCIALSGYAQPRDREQALAAGFDAHLAKPPPLGELSALLEAAERRGRGG